MKKHTLTMTPLADRELQITRVFNAPRDRVWECWTQPELLKKWLSGMPGWSLAECEVDLQVGGKFRYVWKKADDGTLMGMGGIHKEITAQEQLVTTQLFDEDWTGGEAVSTLVLTESCGVTTATNTILYPTREVRDGCITSGMDRGMELSYSRLDEVLAGGNRLRQPGEFCWINMITPQPTDAMEFFAKLLGWTFFEMPGVGHGIKVAGRDIGGIFDQNGPHTPPGTPAHIGVMVKVESADATVERVTALGGKAMPAFDVFDAGRMAVCFDPNGAAFDIWEPKKMPGTDVDPSLPGAPCWFETLTTDTDLAAKFYGELFGWTTEAKPSLMPGTVYTLFLKGEMRVAGMMQILPQMGNFPPHWAVSFAVEDVDDIASRTVALGGTVCVPPTDIPNTGRFCAVISPQGVQFYVMKFYR